MSDEYPYANLDKPCPECGKKAIEYAGLYGDWRGRVSCECLACDWEIFGEAATEFAGYRII